MVSKVNTCSFKRQTASAPGKNTQEALRKLVAKRALFFESLCETSHAIKLTNTHMLYLHIHIFYIYTHTHIHTQRSIFQILKKY